MQIILFPEEVYYMAGVLPREKAGFVKQLQDGSKTVAMASTTARRWTGGAILQWTLPE